MDRDADVDFAQERIDRPHTCRLTLSYHVRRATCPDRSCHDDGNSNISSPGTSAPGLAFVGLSFQYADYSMRYGQTQSGPPSIVSTVKINSCGFTEMMDTEDMFRQWFGRARASRLLP